MLHAGLAKVVRNTIILALLILAYLFVIHVAYQANVLPGRLSNVNETGRCRKFPQSVQSDVCRHDLCMRYAIAIRTWTIVITMLSAKPISSFRDQFSYGVLVLLQSTSPYSSAASRGFSDLRAAPGPLLRGPKSS